MTKPTIAITGANGFLGTVLVNHFENLGWQVIALVRKPQDFKNSKLVTYRPYDITKPIDNSALKDVDYLIHAAYIPFVGKAELTMSVNVEGAENLIAVSRQVKIKKNVFVSSMSSHEQAKSAYGRQKLAIEKLFNAGQDVNLRPGLIIGNGGIVKRMVSFMRSKHIVPLIGSGKQPLQFIDVHDLAVAIENAIRRDLTGTLTVANSQIYTYKQFYREIAKELGIKVTFLPVPFWLLMTLLRLVKLIRIPVPVNEDNLLGLKKSISVNTIADLKTLGIEPTSLKSALIKSKL